MSTTKTPPQTPTIRPYTSYNLFFQLERAYILQTLLKFQPTDIAPQDLFDPTDETNYQGPPLPPRYANLQLPSDWHIPGKTQRRKRIHRKSHGKIGFHEVNDRISKAWQEVDRETRDYCVVLSKLQSKKYTYKNKNKKDDVGKEKNNKSGVGVEEHTKKKKQVIPTKKQQNKSKRVPVVPVVATTKNNEFAHELGFTDFNWDVSISLPQQQDVNVNHDVLSSTNHNHLPTKLRRRVTPDSSAPKIISRLCSPPTLTASSSSCCIQGSFRTEVDMQDDEIIEMYKATTFEDEDTIPQSLRPSQKARVKIPQAKAARQITSLQYNNNNVPLREIGGDNNKRMTFIDAQYKMFQEIGRQSKFSVVPSERVHGEDVAGMMISREELHLDTITARQA